MEKLSAARSKPPTEAAFLSPAIELYRREKAAAVARGANLSGNTHHSFCLTRASEANYTTRPAVSIGDSGDGCFLIFPLTPR